MLPTCKGLSVRARTRESMRSSLEQSRSALWRLRLAMRSPPCFSRDGHAAPTLPCPITVPNCDHWPALLFISRSRATSLNSRTPPTLLQNCVLSNLCSSRYLQISPTFFFFFSLYEPMPVEHSVALAAATLAQVLFSFLFLLLFPPQLLLRSPRFQIRGGCTADLHRPPDIHFRPRHTRR